MKQWTIPSSKPIWGEWSRNYRSRWTDLSQPRSFWGVPYCLFRVDFHLPRWLWCWWPLWFLSQNRELTNYMRHDIPVTCWAEISQSNTEHMARLKTDKVALLFYITKISVTPSETRLKFNLNWGNSICMNDIECVLDIIGFFFLLFIVLQMLGFIRN